MFVFPQQLLIYMSRVPADHIGRVQSACMTVDREHLQIGLYEVPLFWLPGPLFWQNLSHLASCPAVGVIRVILYCWSSQICFIHL